MDDLDAKGFASHQMAREQRKHFLMKTHVRVCARVL